MSIIIKDKDLRSSSSIEVSQDDIIFLEEQDIVESVDGEYLTTDHPDSGLLSIKQELFDRQSRKSTKTL